MKSISASIIVLLGAIVFATGAFAFDVVADDAGRRFYVVRRQFVRM